MSLPLDVVVVGSIGIDTNVYLYGGEIDWSREANFTENLDGVGQAGGYTCRGYAALGRRVGLIGHVGADACGDWVRAELADLGVDTRALFQDPAGTSRSINIMYPDGRRKNFYDGKSHMTLEPDLAVCQDVLAGARLAHFHLPNWGRRLLIPAREAGLVIACDLQDMVSLDDPYRQDFIRHADILFFSAANQQGPEPIMRALLGANPRLIVVAGMGAQGCALGTAAGLRFFPSEPGSEPVVDTNGAGDMLAVGFLNRYVLAGASLEEAVHGGQIAARYICTLKNGAPIDGRRLLP